MRRYLTPFSFLFRIAVFIKNKFYDNGLLKQKELGTNVISVGNLSVGGAGKTPLVEYIARYITDDGKFVAVISKGYKRDYDEICVAEFGFKNEGSQLTSEKFGDEGLMLLDNLSNITKGRGILVVSDNKTKGAKFAYKKFKPDVILIDDGFQHRKLFRNIDIIIIDPHDNEHLLPAGNLREPLSSIKRADVVIVNNKFSEPVNIQAKLKMKPSAASVYEFEGIYNLKNAKINTPSQNATVFSGIANPESFRTLLNQQDIIINEFVAFPDHHYYTGAELKGVLDKFQNNKSNCIITTQKDFVRIKYSDIRMHQELIANYPIYYAKIKLQITDNKELLLNKIEYLLK